MIIANRFNLGGIQIKILDILSELNNDKNLEPILVLRKAEGEFLSQIPERVKIIDLNLGESIFDGMKIIFSLIQVITSNKPKIIVTFSDHISLLTTIARYLSLNSNIPQISNEGIYLSSYLKKQPFGALRKLLIRMLYPLMNKIIVLSKAQKKDLLENFDVPENKIRIINNWVSPNLFRTNSIKDLLTSKKFEVIFVGRLEEQKNLFVFMEIIKQLKKDFPHIKAKLVGTGAQLPLLKQKVKDLYLSRNVNFAGYSADPEKHYRSAKVFLLTSFFEGQPHSVLEAMWFGLPVVAIASPGIDEIVSNGQTGYAILNSDEAVEKLRLLLKNTALREKIGHHAMFISHKKYGVKNLFRLVELINKPIRLL